MIVIMLWIQSVLWMVLIFFASSDVGSAKNTSRIIGPLLRWLFGPIPDETVLAVQFVIRKCAHLTVYAVLAVLLWRALAKPIRWTLEYWNLRQAKAAWLIASLYAVTDEWHQSFIGSRDATVRDVLIDSVGAVAGLMLVRMICRYRTNRGLTQTSRS